MPAEKKKGEEEDEKTKAESTSTEPDEKMGEGEDKKDKANDITNDFGGFSKSYGTNLETFTDKKRWHNVSLDWLVDRNKQEAMVLEVLKCDKSELSSMYRYRSMILFEAYLTFDEASKLHGFEHVAYVNIFYPRNESKTPKRTKCAIFKPRKKQRLNSAIKISEHKKKQEKWKDFNIGDSEEESEDDYDSDDGASSCRYWSYMPFNESGIRWYEVHLENDKSSDEQVALLEDVLKRGRSEVAYIHHSEDLFEAGLTEEEADKVAGAEDVDYLEPRRHVWQLEHRF